MVLATWRLRKLREENEQKLELAVKEAAKESLEKGREQGREQGREEGREQGRREGREQGREEERRRWQAWVRRGEAARAAGLPFDEPSPSERD